MVETKTTLSCLLLMAVEDHQASWNLVRRFLEHLKTQMTSRVITQEGAVNSNKMWDQTLVVHLVTLSHV